MIAANLRFTWTGDPNRSGAASTRPQGIRDVPLSDALGKPASVPSTVFLYFEENSTQGFQTFIFKYDIKLTWSPEADNPPAGKEAPEGQSMLEALKSQLGLKIRQGKANLEMPVVDHLENVPTDN